jgi:transposase
MIADRIEALLADNGYDADAVRDELAKTGIEAVIPAKRNRKDPAPHDARKYKWRNLIERLFNKLKNWRRVATRYDKSKESYLEQGVLPRLRRNRRCQTLATLCP